MTARGTRVDVIADARITGEGRELLPFAGVDDDALYDVILADGLIADIAPAGALPRRGSVLNAEGGWLIPGLWDHHVHMLQWALGVERFSVREAQTAADTAALAARAPVRSDGRRIAVDMRDALWADPATVALLDAATGDVPTYILNLDLHSAWLNSAALRREGFAPDASGFVREDDAFAVARILNDVPVADADAAVGRAALAAAARGVVGCVDLDMTWNEEPWQRRVAGGFDSLRVDFGIYPQHLERAIGLGLQSGDPLRDADTELVRVGPLKVITDGSLGTRTAACSHGYGDDPHNHGMLTVSPEVLVELMTAATAAGIGCAIHAIGDLANSHALDAFASTGAVGRIEHAQLVRHADLARFARLGVGASVQPEHAIDDRELTETLWASQTALAFPLRSLRDAGANILLGSDAPVAPLDPWVSMAAAVFRTHDDRPAWRPEERLDAETALAASTYGGSRHSARIEPGALADLAIVADDPLTAGEERLRTMPVHATMIGGRLTHVA
ncbi:amidohydrolase [Microbacterium paludicola]|uniref:Metal-dependent hydrolase n=1 Tax=Microbacterium paludicola TaxID=300019 RepID=A0A4Y9G1P7_9MICO|nr:amidohydrolase family protein [Microbacterium paludicola]MBF0814944.1 amidohydrolase family protein [Microbacterium paludicola]TFU34670.1 metal-dependent hydrolase [Microbacterium paludicola]